MVHDMVATLFHNDIFHRKRWQRGKSKHSTLLRRAVVSGVADDIFLGPLSWTKLPPRTREQFAIALYPELLEPQSSLSAHPVDQQFSRQSKSLVRVGGPLVPGHIWTICLDVQWKWCNLCFAIWCNLVQAWTRTQVAMVQLLGLCLCFGYASQSGSTHDFTWIVFPMGAGSVKGADPCLHCPQHGSMD